VFGLLGCWDRGWMAHGFLDMACNWILPTDGIYDGLLYIPKTCRKGLGCLPLPRRQSIPPFHHTKSTEQHEVGT
jgi:hypothetical protein